MSLLLIKLTIEGIAAVCKLVGELWWNFAQRFILPFFYAIAVSIVSGVWWLGFSVLPMIGTIVLGYKFTSSDGFNRGLWLFLIVVMAGLGATLLHHESWFAYVPICILSGVWGATTRQLNNIIIAPISGMIIVSNIWFMH